MSIVLLKILSIVVLLSSNVKGGNYLPGDPCDEYFQPFDRVELSLVNLTAVCWRIMPIVGIGREASSIVLYFKQFNLDSGVSMKIYYDAYPTENKFTGQYSGKLGESDTAPPSSLTIEAPIVLLVLQGTGTRTFELYYDTALETNVAASLNIFGALLLVFGIPVIFACLSQCPVVKKWSKANTQNPAKSTNKIANNTSAIFTTVGIGFGLLFFGLVLGRSILL